MTRGNRRHPTHARANSCIEFVDAERIEEEELGADLKGHDILSAQALFARYGDQPTMSKIEMTGKRVPYGSPSPSWPEGMMLIGPVLPKQPPRALTQITKNLSVFKALPGPINFSHQPGAGFASVEAACDEAERPVWRRMTFDLSALSVPQVSYASWNSGSGAEYVSGRGALWVYV